MDLLLLFFMHSLVAPCAPPPEGHPSLNLGVFGQRSHQLSRPARAFLLVLMRVEI